jgi:hypothetical protein
MADLLVVPIGDRKVLPSLSGITPEVLVAHDHVPRRQLIECAADHLTQFLDVAVTRK